MKQAVELLYQNVTVKSGAHREEWDLWVRTPEWNATEEQLTNFLLDYDPVENLAECELASEIPEDVARELHTCFQTHRENRQRLAKAVQARVSTSAAPKARAKEPKAPQKARASPRGSFGKARGMSLDELKAKTTCAACGQVGHWKGDLQCKAKSANEASRAQNDDHDEEADDWYGPDGDYTNEQWAAWEAERYG